MRYLLGKNTTIGRDVELGAFVVVHEHGFVGHNVSIGEETTIGPCSSIANYARIGRQVYIGPSTTVEMYAHVDDFAYLERDIIVSRGAVIGPRASIGAATSIGKEAHIERYARLGTHVVVGDGVVISPYANIEDYCEIRSSIRTSLTVPAGCYIPAGHEPIVGIVQIGRDFTGRPFVIAQSSDDNVFGLYRNQAFDRLDEFADYRWSLANASEAEAIAVFVKAMVELCRGYAAHGGLSQHLWARDWVVDTFYVSDSNSNS